MNVQIRIGPATVLVVADCLPDDIGRSNYVPFVSTTSVPTRATSPACADLTLRVHTAEPPPRGTARLISELPRHWQVYSHEMGYRLEIIEQINFRPSQIVILDRGLRLADVYLLPNPRMPNGSWCLAQVMSPLIQWWLTASLAAERGGLVIHASAVAINGVGLAFVGESGAGKTTIARWCRAGAGAVVLNDERVIIWRSGDGYNVSGTPWHGEWPELAAQDASLAGVFSLSKGQINGFTRWSPAQVVARIVPEAFLPIWHAEAMSGLLETAEALARAVPSGELQFRNDSTIAGHLEKYVNDYGAALALAI